MQILEVLCFHLFLFPIIYAIEDCSISMCGRNNIPIRFPFQLKGQQTKNCGYPGFNLACNSQGITVLELPYSGAFFVRNIDYVTQQVELYDPNNCLPRRLLGFNLSGSPFVAASYHNYTFISCPSQFVRSRFSAVDCLSNSTTSVLATSSLTLAKSLSTSCDIIVTLPIPVSWPVQYEEGFSTNLNGNLQLTWYVPDCGGCETQGGMCRLENTTSQAIGCFSDKRAGQSDGLAVFRIICLSIAIPAFLCTIGIAVFACFMDRTRAIGANATQRNSTTAIVQPQPDIVVMGLDDSTIESYQKLILGESRRLPGPNDSTCPICLTEYCSKETVRCIPECKHCFHADCIDEWLRMNSTCPLCRNSPSPAHVDSQNI